MKHLLLIIALLATQNAMAQRGDYRNTKLKDDQRIDLFIGQLTTDEKIMWLSTRMDMTRQGGPKLNCYEGLHGIALGGPANNNGMKEVDGKNVPNPLPTTIFPQAYGLGCTWNPQAVRLVGQQMAAEARYYCHQSAAKRKGLVIYAPNADLARDPRWGRTEESFGEDPCLTAQLTVAMVRGLQGDNKRYWTAAALMKHFLANSNEDGRDSSSSNFDNRLFREYYAYPFYKGIVEGGARAMMASYNAWNGVPMCINPCLQTIVRDEWGNDGIVCTDGGAMGMLVSSHRAFQTRAEAAAAVVKNRVGQILERFDDDVREALRQGLITEQDIETAIRGNVRVALRLGLLDGASSTNPYARMGADTTALAPCQTDEARQCARWVTEQSVVLLKNNGLLPLDEKKVKRVAVVGPYADQVVYDWYSGTPAYQVTILDALREMGRQQGFEVAYVKDNRMGEAERLAREADVVVACTGNHPYGTMTNWFFCPVPSDGREAVDRKSMQLPDEDLLRQLYRANANTILVLVSSFPYTINWSDEHLPAIVHVTHCSQEQGHAVADALFGRFNPAGRTTQTWVKDMLDLPDMMDYDIRHGRTYMYSKAPALYPFGHGLSYTTFAYGQPKEAGSDKNAIVVSIPVTNNGQRDGEEVVQCYVNYPESEVEHPQQQLKAFAREAFCAGETRTVTLRIPRADLSYWDEATGQFKPEKGRIQLRFGSSSADIRSEITISVR